MISAGALPILVGLMEASPCRDTRSQCAWALGNVTGDGAASRDRALEAGLLAALVRMFQPGAGGGGDHALEKQVAWLLSNVFRFKPRPPVTPAEEPLLAMLARWAAQGGEAAIDAAWTLSYVSDHGANLQACARAGAMAAMLPLLRAGGGGGGELSVTPALRVFGNFVSGSEAETQYALDTGALRLLPALLSHPKRSIRKEALWAVSNVCAGSPAQARLVDEEGLWPAVLAGGDDAEENVAREAVWACANALTSQGSAGARHLVGLGVLQLFQRFLSRPAPSVSENALCCVLEGLGKMLVAAAADKDGEGDAWLEDLREAFEDCELGDCVMAVHEAGTGERKLRARAVLEILGTHILSERGEG